MDDPLPLVAVTDDILLLLPDPADVSLLISILSVPGVITAELTSGFTCNMLNKLMYFSAQVF